MIQELVRVLLVDDFEPFRSMVSSLLERQPALQVIGCASDGADAVKQGEILQPDLILLDIGLPTLNGIEAARQIRVVSPKSVILFLSANCSTDVARAALHTGARGYIVKADVVNDLLPAVDAVLMGKQFMSPRFASSGLIW